MQDRTPTPGQEGRVLITPENGSPYYAKIEMADNPTQPGTPLNKATLLTDETEQAIWGNTSDRTVDDALKILSDVAYGRVSILNLTVLDTIGNPIPDVAVALDTTPNIVDGPLTDENGTLTINTSGGSHTVNLAYPLGYSAETGSQAIEVSGVRNLTVQAVSRKNTSEIFTFSLSKRNFRIARFLSPIQICLFGGGGSGCVMCANKDDSSCGGQAGAGGYTLTQNNVDIAGKLISVFIGAGGGGSSMSFSYGSGRRGNSGGTTSINVGGTVYSAKGGGGGDYHTFRNANNILGGAYGGGWQGANLPTEGQDGSHLFGDSSQPVYGGGGGGVASYGSDAVGGNEGQGGGTSGSAYDGGGDDRYPDYTESDDATTAGGSGGALSAWHSTGARSGKGGSGLAAFRKQV